MTRELLSVAAGACFVLGAAVAAPALPASAGRGLETLWRAEVELAAALGWRALGGRRLLLVEAAVALGAGGLAWTATGLAALGAVGAVAGAVALRSVAAARGRSLRAARQQAVIESVRSLRQLLDAGGVGVQQALAALAGRGPASLRPAFALVVAAAATGRQREAWRSARATVGEPMFDLLAAALLMQRPSGGELGPLLADLEASLTGLNEVVREAEALQVQARGAAAIIALLPIAFLVALSALHSPYLDAYRRPAGEAFLLSMLAVMGLSYLWILRWLRLPAEPRLRLTDE